jgi:magnesium transporter
VVDREGRMLGRISHDDIVHVIVEEAEEDALKQAGTSAEELLYRDRVFPIVRVRLPWLVSTLFGALLAATILYFYQGVLAHTVLLVCFIPVVTALSRNVGAQSATIVARRLLTGRTNSAELGSTVFRELRTGLVLGALCGGIASVLAAVLFSPGDVLLGAVVFAALLAAMTAAATIGTLAPVFMRKLRVDPAIAAGPFVGSVNDIVSLLVYLSTALLFIEALAR